MKLKGIVEEFLSQVPMSLRPRMHPLKGFAHPWLVARDDELSFGISGSKLRKLLSLTRHWQSQGIKHVVAMGGARSNHLVATLQVCHELGIDCDIVTPKTYAQDVSGNAFFLSLLARDDRIHSLAPEDWETRKDFIGSLLSRRGDGNSFVMEEGGYSQHALLGGLSLGYYLADRMESEYRPTIVLDAGTGGIAASCAVYLTLAGYQGKIAVVHMAGLAGWDKVLRDTVQWTEALIQEPVALPSVVSYRPPSAASFGATSQSVFLEIIKQARENGILTDPIYSGKLFMTMRYYEEQGELDGGIAVHSGGALALEGFRDKIIKYL